MVGSGVVSLGLSQATVTSLATVMIIGLGFLRRPSRASLLWSLAFVLAMVSTWVTIAGEALLNEDARRAGLGFMLGAPALIWSGFRARRDARALPWISPALSLISAAVLIGVVDPAWYSIAFRSLFFVASVFAGLALLEMRRFAGDREQLVIPLALASGAFFVTGVFVFVAGLISPAASTGDLSLVRTLNSLGMLAYLMCATVTLLFLTSVSPVGVHRASSWPQFTVTAADRLARARRANETSWAMLAIRIDDPEEMRGAAGESAFAQVVERFEQIVRSSLPAEADIGREARGRLVVLVARPGPVLREHVRDMLRQITEIDTASQIAVQLSASVGWAPADAVGYDFAVLLSAAQRAAEEASVLGGDRWQRIGA